MILLRFIEEFYKWIRYGRQYRSKSRMKEVYSICKSCPNFKKGGGWLSDYDSCNICGCNIHPVKRPVNKIAWATTSCPDKEPKWTAEIKTDGSGSPPF